MLTMRSGLAVLTLLLVSAPAVADTPEILKGKFTFNWHSEPGRQKCLKVDGPVLASFKSSKYRCDLNAKSNTASGASARTCTEVKGSKEYLIFDTMRACETERKTQDSNS